jgi:hypothetical protein
VVWGIYLLARGEEEEKGRVGVLKNMHDFVTLHDVQHACLKRKDEEKGEPWTFVA